MGEGQPFKILIVDDDAGVRDVLQRTLHRVGYTATATAHSFGSACRILASQGPFALVITDVDLPDESGLTLLARLAPKAPHTVVILISGGHRPATAREASEKGAYDYLRKPLDVDTLRRAVESAVQRRERKLQEMGGSAAESC